jgi:hypothetical protein
MIHIRLLERSCAIVVMLGIGSQGCAAVFKGRDQSVQFVSSPSGATVESNGRYLGDTPTSARMDRLGGLAIKMSRTNYVTSYGTLRRRPDAGWFVVDIATCVIPVLLCVPLLVDALSGSLMDLDEAYRVKLEPLPTAPAVSTEAPSPLPSPETSHSL